MVNNLLTKLKVVSISILLIIIPMVAFGVGAIYAADSEPVPQARLPCDLQLDPEFQSLRPYQAAPCEDAEFTLYCGNKINIVETKSESKNGCWDSLATNWTVDKDYYIDLSETELPILGNTELVQNSQTDQETLDDATKLNEYVSWYLQGTNTRAEYGDDKSADYETVNLSGPLQKLLPQAIAEAQRITTIASASAVTTVAQDEDDAASSATGPASHNQIVVCTEGGEPTPCYKGDGSAAQGRVYRLKDWAEGSLSPLTTFFNWIGTDVWNNRYPPLPWQFSEEILYQKAYLEWRGKTCAIVPIVNKLVCADLPVVSNRNDFADLYTYIPLASTSDFLGKMAIYTTTIQPSSGTIMDFSTWDKLAAPTLFYSHTKESLDLVNSLNKTFAPSGADTQGVPPNTTEDNNKCRILETRSNPGDDLFTIKKPGDVGVHVNFHVSELQSCECTTVIDDNGKETKRTTCHGQVSIGIHTDPNKVPFANEIWKSTVAGNASTFRRIYPKVAENAPVTCVADIPSVTKAVYVPVEGTNKITVEGPLGSPDQEVMDPEDARIYFPHFGSVYDYFLKGIQTALRPKDYAEPTPISGEYCENVTENGDCSWNMQKINTGIRLAAAKYKVPESLLKAIFEIESYEIINGAETYQCVPNFAGALGVAQITQETYDDVTCDNEKMDDINQCGSYNPKLSRCNFEDAFELMARILLYKAGRWSTANCGSPGQGISESETQAWYNAACNYYGTFAADALTINLANDIPEASRRQDGYMNYCDIVGYKMGKFPPYPAR